MPENRNPARYLHLVLLSSEVQVSIWLQERILSSEIEEGLAPDNRMWGFQTGVHVNIIITGFPFSRLNMELLVYASGLHPGEMASKLLKYTAMPQWVPLVGKPIRATPGEELQRRLYAVNSDMIHLGSRSLLLSWASRCGRIEQRDRIGGLCQMECRIVWVLELSRAMECFRLEFFPKGNCLLLLWQLCIFVDCKIVFLIAFVQRTKASSKAKLDRSLYSFQDEPVRSQHTPKTWLSHAAHQHPFISSRRCARTRSGARMRMTTIRMAAVHQIATLTHTDHCDRAEDWSPFLYLQ